MVPAQAHPGVRLMAQCPINHRGKPGDDGSDACYVGPLTRFGLTAAVVACALDQASKLYLLKVFDLAVNGPVRLGPFFDLVLTRNTGISYGLFQTQGEVGQWVLLAVKAAAVLLLWVWLAHARDRLTRARARADHRRGARQRHRPAGLWLGRRFRAFPHYR